MWNKVQETVNYIHSKTNHFSPDFGVILGSGLGGFF